MGKRKVSNPLALAVLTLLAEKPMHPYEMSSTLRERAKEQSIKLNYGSLYSVVDSLVRHRLIEVQEVVREGKRPERTVYAITDAGRIEFVDWLTELLATPVKEYLQFEAALSLMPTLAPGDVVRLLESRLLRLDTEIAATEAVLAKLTGEGMAGLWLIEVEYMQVMRRAERGFVSGLIEKIKKEDLPDIMVWRRAHEAAAGDVPNENDWQKAAADQPDFMWPSP
jgi:DNA-binding PadR family transcriptional regulator